MYASFAGPGGILSPVDTGYGSGDGKVALSVDNPGHTCMETGMNELQENGTIVSCLKCRLINMFLHDVMKQ